MIDQAKDFVNNQVFELKKLWKNKRQLTYQALNLAMVVFSALMIWKGLMVVTGSESPVVVVLRYVSVLQRARVCLLHCDDCGGISWGSGSMETAFQRGDILFLTNYNDPIRVGEIVVFKIKHRDIPIVHRVLEVHEDSEGKIQLLTKGDNNRVDDRGLYAPGQVWLPREDVLGRAKG